MKVPVVSGRSMTKRGAWKLKGLKGTKKGTRSLCRKTHGCFLSLNTPSFHWGKSSSSIRSLKPVNTQMMDSCQYNWMRMNWLLQKKGNLMSVVFNENVPRWRCKSSSCLGKHGSTWSGLKLTMPFFLCISPEVCPARDRRFFVTTARFYPKETPSDPNRFFYKETSFKQLHC